MINYSVWAIFKTLRYGGHYGPHLNFAVSLGKRTKFGSIGYFDVLSSKRALIFKFRASMMSL